MRKKVSHRKTSVVWVDENGTLRVYPLIQNIENDDGEHFWSHPEGFLFVHDNVTCTRDGSNFIVNCEDQDIIVDSQVVFRFRGDIRQAIEASLVGNEQYVQTIEPFGATTCVLIADPNTNPDQMSMFFNLELVKTDDFDPNCPACVVHYNHAEKILEFLDHSVFIPKSVNVSSTRFLQRNMKRAIFINEISKGAILKWLVETFRVTFERAHVKEVILHDLEHNEKYIETV